MSKKTTKKKQPLVVPANHCTLELTVEMREYDSKSNLLNKESACRHCLGKGITKKELIHWSAKKYDSIEEAMVYANRIFYNICKDGSISIKGDYKIIEKKTIVYRKLVFIS